MLILADSKNAIWILIFEAGILKVFIFPTRISLNRNYSYMYKILLSDVIFDQNIQVTRLYNNGSENGTTSVWKDEYTLKKFHSSDKYFWNSLHIRTSKICYYGPLKNAGFLHFYLVKLAQICLNHVEIVMEWLSGENGP